MNHLFPEGVVAPGVAVAREVVEVLEIADRLRRERPGRARSSRAMSATGVRLKNGRAAGWV